MTPTISPVFPSKVTVSPITVGRAPKLFRHSVSLSRITLGASGSSSDSRKVRPYNGGTPRVAKNECEISSESTRRGSSPPLKFAAPAR